MNAPDPHHPSSSAASNRLQIQPYLYLDGRCDEAIAFYQRALGAEVTMLMRFQESPEPPPPGVLPPDSGNKVMHAAIRIGDSTVLLSDGRCQGDVKHDGFSLSLTAPTVGDADRLFAALADGGKVGMPLAKTFFSPRFGMLADRFGVSWLVYVVPADSKG